MTNPARDVLGLFLHFSQTNPDAIALQDGDVKLTYNDLDKKSYTVAAQLRNLGVGRNDIVPLVAEPSQYMAIGILGILRAGASYVPLDCLQWPATTMKNVISRMRPTVTVFTNNIFDLGSTSLNVSIKDLVEQPMSMANASTLGHAAAIQHEDLICVIFTSGTTGKPKGVMVRHSSVFHFVTSPPFNYHITANDRVLLVLSVAFDACMATFFSVICNGGCLVLADASTLQSRIRSCNVFVGTPSILGAISPPSSSLDYPELDRIVLGGETPSVALLRQWKTIERAVWVAYGPTEATCAVLTGQVHLFADEPSDPRMLEFVIDQATVIIVNENMAPITSLEEEGELLILGPGLAKGYWQDEKQTSNKFITFEDQRAFRTGDYAKWVKDPCDKPIIYFCGRKDRTVKLQGFLVNLDTDLDAAIAKNVPEVKGVFSYVDHGKLHTTVWPQALASALLFRRLEQILPRYMLPAHTIVLAGFPQTSSGKLDIMQLRNAAHLRLEETQSVDHSHLYITPLWEVVLSGLYDVSGLSRSAINPHLSFIANGVHSLAAVRLSFHLQKFGFTHQTRDILSAETIISFVESSLDRRSADGGGQIVPITHRLNDSSRPADLTIQQRRLVCGTLQCPHFNVVNHILECDLLYLDRLKTAWRDLSQVEPILRTLIQVSDAQYTQVEQDASILVWSERYIRQEEYERQLISIAAEVGFGSRCTILKFRHSSRSAFVWSIHHALIDGFSASLLLEKLRRIINAQQIETSLSFTEAVHSLQVMTEMNQERSQAFWKEQEEKFPSVAGDLPVRQPNMTACDQTLSHDTHTIDLKRFQDRMANFCYLKNVTSAAVHYAVWSLVLSAYTGSSDVCFGAIMSGRDLPLYRSDLLIGCLLDTLPLRIRVDCHMTVTKFVWKVHQSLREIAQFHGSISQTSESLYSTAVSFEPGMPEWDFHRLGFPARSRIREYPSLPMSVIVQCDGRVRFLYRTSHYVKNDVVTLSKIYEKELELLLSKDLVTVGEVLQQRFSREEANRILALGNAHHRESYKNSDVTTVESMLGDAASKFSSSMALEKADMSMTYRQLHRHAGQLALHLRSHIRPGDTVCIFADRSPNWIVGVVAIFKSSAVYCPVDIGLTQSGQQDVIRLSKCALVLCNNPGQQHSVQDLKKPAILTAQILRSSQHPRVCKSIRTITKPNDPAFLVFTSGSTGRPKGILIEHGSLVAVLNSSRRYIVTKSGDRIAQFMSPGFDAAMYEILISLCFGSTLVLRREPNDPFSHLYDVDMIMMTPSVAVNLDPTDFPNTRLVSRVNLHRCLMTKIGDEICLAGEPVPDRVVLSWATDHCDVYNMYGPAEATILTSIQRLKPGVPINAGPPLYSMRLYILNDRRELLPPGVLGSIYVAGIQVSRGYINDEIKTRTDFHNDIYASSGESGERMYCTGDLGYLDCDGNIHCVGRRDRQIKLRGIRTDLDSLANNICQLMPEIAKAFVTDQHGSLVLWLEPENIDTGRLRVLFRENVSVHATIARIVTMSQLPLNNNGKIDARKLNNHDFADKSDSLQAEILSPVEQTIADEWRSLLGLKATVAIKKSDTFLHHGGNSVLQLALAQCLRRKIGTRIHIKDIIDAPVLEELAWLIEKRKTSPLVPQDPQRVQVQVAPIDLRLADTATKMTPLGRSHLTPPELYWWACYRYGQQHSAFNVPFVATLASGVDLGRLKRSLDQAIARHEVLKSRFHQNDGDETPQRVLSSEPIRAHIVQMEFDLKEFFNRPFDLARDALVRVCLNSSILAISISHILIDMTGLRCLLADVAACYRSKSQISPLPQTRQYFDVHQWNTAVPASRIAFWRTYLHNLPSYKKMETVQRSYRGQSLLSNVSDEAYGLMRLRASEQDVSLHHFLLSAVALALQSLGSCNDIVLGVPYINRPCEEDRDVVGLFLEPLPIRLGEFHCEWSSSRLLQETRSSAQSALINVLPWSELMKLRGSMFPSDRHELFRSVVTLHDDRYTTRLLPIPGVESQMVWTEGAKFPMCVEFHAGNERLTMRIEYDSDVMNGSHAQILQALLLCAVSELLEPYHTHTSLCERIDCTLSRVCGLEGISTDEMRKVARDHLL